MNLCSRYYYFYLGLLYSTHNLRNYNTLNLFSKFLAISIMIFIINNLYLKSIDNFFKQKNKYFISTHQWSIHLNEIIILENLNFKYNDYLTL